MKIRSTKLAGCVAGIGLMAMMSAQAGDWRFPVGFSYISGLNNVKNSIEDNYYRFENVKMDYFVPVGISFVPYYEFDHGSRIGLDLGPAAIVVVDEHSSYKVPYWDVPLALSYGFTFIPTASISPYARVGVKYHIVGGDAVDSSTPGFFGAAGVEFFRKSAVGLGLEVGYDTSEVKLKPNDTVKPGEFLVSLRAIF